MPSAAGHGNGPPFLNTRPSTDRESRVCRSPFPEAPAQSASSDITDDEFEQLLDALQGDEAPASAVAEAPAAPAGDEISDAEFEALLDQLHGKGKFVPPAVSAEPAQVPAEASSRPRLPLVTISATHQSA